MKQVVGIMGMVLLAGAMGDVWASGTIDMASPVSGNGWTVAGGVVRITSNGFYTVTGVTTSNRIEVAGGVSATITLSNASITSSVGSPLELSADNCNVTLRLEGSNNRLVATTWQTNPLSAGLQVPQGASVVIEGTGALYAKGCGQEDVNGNDGGAGIGSAGVDSEPGKVGKMSGTVTINSGSITAAGDGGAGIGGGSCGGAGTIIINGGAVTATGGYTAAGIGSGLYSAGVNNITINGGTVVATGGMYAAAIGGGAESPGGNITITGGTIMATGKEQGAGIGGGTLASAGVINITSGNILAVGGAGAAGIGSGYAGEGGTVNISGGSIFAWSSDGAGIGASASAGTGVGGGSISIAGGMVMANTVGIAQSGWAGGLTPTTVTDGAILVNAINTNSFGQAQVMTGVSLSLEMLRAMAVNIPRNATLWLRDTVNDTTVVRVPARTIITHDTLSVPLRIPDSVFRDTTVVYTADTVYRHTVQTHDTFRIALSDTLWRVDIIYRDTIVKHDTITRWDYYRLDTLYFPMFTGDTIRIEEHDTLQVPIPVAPIETHDTFYLVTTQIRYVVITRDSATGATNNFEVFDYPYATEVACDGSATIYDLTPQTRYIVYNFAGQIIADGLADPFGQATLPRGTLLPCTLPPQACIIYNNSCYWKWTPLQ